MDKLRPVEDVVDEIYQSSKLPSKVLQADRRAHEEIIGRNVDRALRAAGCPERFLQTACVATVVMPPPESDRVRLGRKCWNARRCERDYKWEDLPELEKEAWREIAAAVLAEQRKIEEEQKL